MDCEKFDRVVLDLLYEELDELTSAAARRHMEHCTRCRGVGSRLRATREVGVLPLVSAPEGLTERILQAEQRARSELGFRQRFGRAVSILAGYAMRPQLAMAALFLLMVGGSLLFLRAHPGERDHVHVTERGVPEGENEGVAVVPLPEKLPVTDNMRAQRGHDEARRDKSAEAEPAGAADQTAAAAPAASVAANADSAYDDAMNAYRGHHYDDAKKRFQQIANSESPNAGRAALYAALAAKKSSGGCASAIPLFTALGQKYPGTTEANEATYQIADCQRFSGQLAEARQNYGTLSNVDGFSDRARQALAEIDQSVLAARKAARAAPPAAAKAAPKAGAADVSTKSAPAQAVDGL